MLLKEIFLPGILETHIILPTLDLDENEQHNPSRSG